MATTRKRRMLITDVNPDGTVSSKKTKKTEAPSPPPALDVVAPTAVSPAPRPSSPVVVPPQVDLMDLLASTPVAAAAAQSSHDPLVSMMRHNLKGPERTVKLGLCTAFVSPFNRVGKTAMLDAFRLGLTGKHPVGPHAADLASLSHGAMPMVVLDGKKFHASFHFPEGRRTAEHVVSGFSGDISSGQLEQLLPLLRVEELLSLGSAKAREVIFNRFGDAESAKTIQPLGLTPGAQKLYDMMLKQIESEMPGADLVVQLSEAGGYLRSTKTGLSAKEKTLREAAGRAQESMLVAGPPSDDLLTAVERKLQAKRAAAGHETFVKSFEAAKARLQSAYDAWKAIPEPLPEAEAQALWKAKEESRLAVLGGLETRLGEAATAHQKARDVLVALTNIDEIRAALTVGTPCPVCLTNVSHRPDDTGALRKQVEAVVGQRKAVLDGLKIEMLTLVDEGTAARRKEEQEYQTLMWRKQNAWQAVVIERDNVERIKSSLDASAAEGLSVTETIPELEAQLRQLHQAKLAASNASAYNSELQDIVLQQTFVKEVDQAVAQMLARLLNSVKARAEAAVNAWMPKGFTAALRLADADNKAVCWWEVIGKDGEAHPLGAMSGAERGALSVALACAWPKNDDSMKVVLLDDMNLAGFNPENLRLTLDMLREKAEAGALSQVIVAWSRPDEIPTTGWTVVHLS